ncbi:hypothetical protein MKZ38_002355 [Zalerion maritima]|uniref:Uncharacterized protein n=1 Tax=Zalerion maritima TaxID=339359 RepID=A0AAD5RYC7_9PEZI|nr:hypothetical protein MKZ38_002355 [Zalerion maritima]
MHSNYQRAVRPRGAAITGWCEPSRPRAKNSVEWEAIFDFLIQILLEAGNDILCLAARSGCLMLIKRLFEAAKVDPDLKAAIMADNRKTKSAAKGPRRSRLPPVYRPGSLGGSRRRGPLPMPAAWHRALWARYPDAQVFRILIQNWPEGVYLKNVGNDTPLVDFIFNCNEDEDEVIEHLQMLIVSMGNVDASGKDDEAWHTPLRTAARQAKAKVCRFPITDGSADIYSVLGVDQVSSAGDQKAWDEVKMPEELCSLLPLAVSADYILVPTCFELNYCI